MQISSPTESKGYFQLSKQKVSSGQMEYYQEVIRNFPPFIPDSQINE
jgi:hypothetical protein